MPRVRYRRRGIRSARWGRLRGTSIQALGQAPDLLTQREAAPIAPIAPTDLRARARADVSRGVFDWVADNKLLVIGVGLGLVALVAYTQRKRIGMFFDYAKSGAFKVLLNTLPQYATASRYSDIILEESQAASISPIVTLSLGQRESLWGDALSPKGPGGVGDNGHGHGLMQIDDRSFAEWLAENDWKDPRTNVRKGLAILKTKLAFFASRRPVQGVSDGSYVLLTEEQAGRRGANIRPGAYPDPRPLSGDVLVQAAIAAYNTGEGNVLRSLAVGVSPDVTTAAGGGSKTGNYSADVLARSAALAKKLTEIA